MKKNYLFLFSISLLFVFSRCEKAYEVPTPIEGALGDTITLAFKQTAIFPNEDFQIRFDEVVLDTRCPPDAFCILPGFVEIRLSMKQGAAEDTAILNAPVSIFNRNIRQLNVFPASQPRTQEEYTIRILVN